MNYTGRYGIEMNPFIKNGKSVLIETAEFKEAMTRLDYLLNTRGFGLLTGEAGRGKTTVIRAWAESLNRAAYKVVYISLSTVTVLEFYKGLATELGIEPEFRKNQIYRQIQKEIERLSIEKRIVPVIILDEANYMNSGIMNDLKMLFNFDMDSKDRAVVLLVGLPRLISMMNLTANEPLKQRIVMNYHMDSLSKEESRKYIEDKIRKAGGNVKVFEENAIEAIVNNGMGVPRILDKLCNQCMVIGNSLNENIISEETVMKTVNDIQLG